MALLKASIEVQGEKPIVVLFNPGQYSLEKSNQYAAIGMPGLSAPIVQYVHGGARQLSMELFFDTYESGGDVRQHTDRVFGLLEIRKETHVPPICTFAWGSLRFQGVAERVGGRFTLFLPNGVPVRAVLAVTFREVIDVKQKVRDVATESVDRHKTRIVAAGDTLSGIAAVEYGDPAKWRVIARANGIVDPRNLKPGQPLQLPPLL